MNQVIEPRMWSGFTEGSSADAILQTIKKAGLKGISPEALFEAVSKAGIKAKNLEALEARCKKISNWAVKVGFCKLEGKNFIYVGKPIDLNEVEKPKPVKRVEKKEFTKYYASVRLKTSKNAITIDQLKLACRHVEEMIAAGVTENLAIRTLELFADVYAKLHMGGSATPNHVDEVKLWSIKARKLRQAIPDAKPKDYFRVEHGTPIRGFAREVLGLCQKNKLNTKTMVKLVERDYKLAVITLEEDQHLNSIARSTKFATPEERWAAAGIKF